MVYGNTIEAQQAQTHSQRRIEVGEFKAESGHIGTKTVFHGVEIVNLNGCYMTLGCFFDSLGEAMDYVI